MSLTIAAAILLWCGALLQLAEGDVTKAGKCDPNRKITTIHIDYAKMEKNNPYTVHYLTILDSLEKIDRARALVSKNRQGALYSAVTSIFPKGGGKPRCNTYTQQIISSGVVKETGIDDKGDTVVFMLYYLAEKDNAILYYRCCVTQTAVNVDTRYIISSTHHKVTTHTLDKLKQIDEGFKFNGGWYDLEPPE